MKNLLRSNKFTSSFYQVLSAPMGDDHKEESFGPVLEIKVSNPLRDLSGNFSGQRVAGI